MKTALILLFATVASTQQEKPEEKKRLTSVTWNLESHKLVWEIQKGREFSGRFIASSTEKYEISPDEASMAVLDEKRGFSEDEAQNLHRLLDTLSLYCAESAVWWDQGEGTKLAPDGTPADRPPSRQAPRERVDHNTAPSPSVPLRYALLRARTSRFENTMLDGLTPLLSHQSR